MLSAIVAVAKNGVIGNSNELPWYLPADLRHFKNLTSNHAVIMGHTTYDSIVRKLGHSLPNRQSIVITRNPDFFTNDAVSAISLEQALLETADEEPFIIGGAQIYELAAYKIQRWYVTEINADVEGDVMLEGFDKSNFKEVSREHHSADNKNQYDYDFVIYERT